MLRFPFKLTCAFTNKDMYTHSQPDIRDTHCHHGPHADTGTTITQAYTLPLKQTDVQTGTPLHLGSTNTHPQPHTRPPAQRQMCLHTQTPAYVAYMLRNRALCQHVHAHRLACASPAHRRQSLSPHCSLAHAATQWRRSILPSAPAQSTPPHPSPAQPMQSRGRKDKNMAGAGDVGSEERKGQKMK